MFWSKAEKWVESEDSGGALTPQGGLPDGEGGVGDDPGGFATGLDGQIPAAGVPQVVLGVGMVATAESQLLHST